MENKFKDEDKQKVIEFLNFVAQKATFNDLKVEDNIKFFRLLNYMQATLIPKIDANVLEIKQIINPPKKTKESKVKE
jgi:hypothetical protein